MVVHVSGLRPGVGLALAYAAVGFSPILALALAIGSVCGLPLSATVLVGSACIGAVFLVRRFPESRQPALEGFCAGLLAVFGYDLARWLTIAAGWWGDFIPSIGGWLLGTQQPDIVVGYAYRWLGDGGGMGMAFVVAVRLVAPTLGGRTNLALGFAYGVAIWVCLIVTLLISPDGQHLLFPLTLVTLALSLGGHLIYGGLLGVWVAWFGPNHEMPASRNRSDSSDWRSPALAAKVPFAEAAEMAALLCHRPAAQQTSRSWRVHGPPRARS
jgi:hypothetical protein